jgi:hypothetical protein
MPEPPGAGRRLLVLLVALGAIGSPAAVLRAACAGNACPPPAPAAEAPPFCRLPAPMRALLAAGFYEGRSPDVLAVTDAERVAPPGGGAPWPALADARPEPRAPLAFIGPAVVPGPVVEAALADVAPTLEPLLGLVRPHPQVRSGRAIPGVVRPGRRSPLVVVVAWKGLGRHRAGPLLRRLGRLPDAAVGAARVGSLPLAPAAVLTTIGSGGSPAEHGITDERVRGRGGGLAEAWSSGAPTSVIATLGDDLDEATGGPARIGLVADRASDRGLIGGTWYGGRDDDDLLVGRRPLEGIRRLLDAGYGAGGSPDLLGVSLDVDAHDVVATTRRVLAVVFGRVAEATVVVAGTGSAAPADALDAHALAREVERAIGARVVAGVGAAGLWLDEGVAADRGIGAVAVATALARLRAADGRPLVAAAFPAFAVTFGRFC